jgi:hypothetical protein
MIRNRDIKYTIEKGEFTLFGSLVSEDADYFFDPLIKKLKLIVEGKRDLIFNFKFDYYNTSATIYITAIINLMEKLSLSAEVKVNWYYDKDDEIIQELGEMYIETSKIKINMIVN